MTPKGAIACVALVCGCGSTLDLGVREDAGTSTGSTSGLGSCTSGAPSGGCWAFVTSTEYRGNLGGTSGADEQCALVASVAQVRGSYRAYLSDGREAAWARIHARGPWTLVGSGEPILTGPAALRLNTDITFDRDERGDYVLGAQYWTGVDERGAPGEHCLGFSSSDPFETGAAGGWPKWMSTRSASCGGLPLRLLCLEVAP